MKMIQNNILALAAAVFFVNCVCGLANTIPPQDDEAGLELSTDINGEINFDTTCSIKLTNQSAKPIRIWNPAIREGRYALSLQLKNLKTNRVYHVKRCLIDDEEYWQDQRQNLEASQHVILIAPGESYTFKIQPGMNESGQAVWVDLPIPNTDQKYTCIARYHCPASNNAGQLWTGDITSVKSFVLITSDKYITPHELARNKNPAQAIEVMKVNPEWIHRKDDEQRTPLHIAARFAQYELIDWLLENGADVNSIGYNGFTPLHMATDIKAIEKILHKKPNLKIRCRIHGQTPLQGAVEYFCHAQTDESKSKWKQIIGLYQKHGAYYDIHSAIKLGDLARVKEIVTDKPLFAVFYQNRAPLRVAASVGNLEICEYLLDNFKLDVDDFERGIGYPIIVEAVAYPKVLKLLIEHNADLERRITWQGGRSGVWIIGDEATCLHFAASDGVPESIKVLLDAGVDPFALDKHLFGERPQTALEVAAIVGNTANAIAILKHPSFNRAAGDLQLSTLESALQQAAYVNYYDKKYEDRIDLVEAIVNKSNRLDLKRIGTKAIRIAVETINLSETERNQIIRKMVSTLRQHGAEMDVYSAVAIGDLKETKRLLSVSSDAWNSYSISGVPALHTAVDMNHVEIVRLLLNKGADVEVIAKSEIETTSKETALHSAAFWGRMEIGKLLLNAGADVNSRGDHELTPLHEAVRLNNADFARLLLENGADLNAKDKDGRTPLDFSDDNPIYQKLFDEFKTQKDKRR